MIFDSPVLPKREVEGKGEVKGPSHGESDGDGQNGDDDLSDVTDIQTKSGQQTTTS